MPLRDNPNLRVKTCFKRRPQGTDIFVCDEESHFYSQCLEKLVVKNSSGTQTVVEFGSGDGTPVIGCLMHSQFSGTIHGFELNKRAADLANSRAIETQVSKHYKVSLEGLRLSITTAFFMDRESCIRVAVHLCFISALCSLQFAYQLLAALL